MQHQILVLEILKMLILIYQIYVKKYNFVYVVFLENTVEFYGPNN